MKPNCCIRLCDMNMRTFNPKDAVCCVLNYSNHWVLNVGVGLERVNRDKERQGEREGEKVEKGKEEERESTKRMDRNAIS